MPHPSFVPSAPRDLACFVVIPARNEAERIGRVLARLPAWLSGVVLVDDASTDSTVAVARATQRAGLEIVEHPNNRGVGAALSSGYRRALELGAEVMVVMAGDDQMDPADLDALLAPIARGEADYVKGNRFQHPDYAQMPLHRRLGSWLLAHLTNLVSGLRIQDSQCGYTALSASAAQALDLEGLWPRYGYPNDLLIQLALRELPVVEVPVRPVYAGEKSGLRPWHLLSIALLILRLRRLRQAEFAVQAGRLQCAP